jgi:hypothetical protein
MEALTGAGGNGPPRAPLSLRTRSVVSRQGASKPRFPPFSPAHTVLLDACSLPQPPSPRPDATPKQARARRRPRGTRTARARARRHAKRPHGAGRARDVSV